MGFWSGLRVACFHFCVLSEAGPFQPCTESTEVGVVACGLLRLPDPAAASAPARNGAVPFTGGGYGGRDDYDRGGGGYGGGAMAMGVVGGAAAGLLGGMVLADAMDGGLMDDEGIFG